MVVIAAVAAVVAAMVAVCTAAEVAMRGAAMRAAVISAAGDPKVSEGELLALSTGRPRASIAAFGRRLRVGFSSLAGPDVGVGALPVSRRAGTVAWFAVALPRRVAAGSLAAAFVAAAA